MNRTIPIAIGAILLLILVLWNTTYTVNFHEIAVRTRFGRPERIDHDAGLHFKMPFFIDQVTKLDTRNQVVDSALETVMTRDQQQVVVQAFLFWKIDDEKDASGKDGALRFFTAYQSIEEANRFLEQQLQTSIRAVGGLNFNDLIGANSKLPEAEKAILADLNRSNITGIKPISVGIGQVLLPPKTTAAVLARMAEVQNTLARLEETRGSAQAESLKSSARTKADTISGFAETVAQRLSAQGDTEAARYYEEMAKHRDLAMFLSWLDTLKASLSGATTIITDMDHAPNHLLDLASPTNDKGIPLPPKSMSEPAPAPSQANATPPATNLPKSSTSKPSGGSR